MGTGPATALFAIYADERQVSFRAMPNMVFGGAISAV